MVSEVELERSYSDEINAALWAWADRHHVSQLDGGRRDGRPPVFGQGHAQLNVLIPTEEDPARTILEAIPAHKRHRHFGSMRSSQALAQSVLGALAACGKLSLLENLKAECGRAALCEEHYDWSVELEHDVRTLGEPRPTSIDALATRPGYRVAIECKLTEPDFGTCSRPRLRPSEGSFDEQFCNGSYSIQRGRSSRCSLTEIGVQYWRHLPSLFNWDSTEDLNPCPFGFVYQVARNALAAVVTSDGKTDLDQGHVLVIYDARNPAFQSGGLADQQWEAAMAACRVPGLLRKTTWQNVVGALITEPEMRWLAAALQGKYGFTPN